MRYQPLVPLVLGLIVVLAAAAEGCGGGETTAATGTGSSTTTTGGGGAGGQGGTGGQGGSGSSTSSSTSSSSSSGSSSGTGMAAHGPPASDIVSAGEVARSPGYKMVFTFGQSSPNQHKTTSPSYRHQGGLVGANGSLP